ncbi:permease [Natrinema limicola]|uniref:Permease n=1 Tax=Natrinema limicola JCM 13563 TaxID=1230457 RepID=M0C2W9_9EURY|nr:permease [Natrinema limicola]ELZ17631.1 permease [Natrinema limicola JCM 13563]
MVFQQIATYVVEALGLTGSLRAAAHFWIYDTLKILSILIVVIFGVTYLRTYFPPEKIRDYLEGKRAITGYALAALLGIVSPFCSCSTIPIFLGMVGAGIPFGITITFLAVSPMINEAALVVLPGVVGFKLTALYAVSGIVIGMSSGYTLNKLGFDRYIEEFNFGDSDVEIDEPTRKERAREAYVEAKDIIVEIVPYVIVGVGAGAAIHGYLPGELVTQYLSGPLGVFGAVAVGVPMYTDILGVIPVVESLIGKGLPVGTGLAFMMSVAALSFPQFMILNKVMKKELIAAYATTLAAGILTIGLLFNLLL